MSVVVNFSQISAKSREETGKIRKSFKRPTSAAKKQEPLAEEVILNLSGQDTLNKVQQNYLCLWQNVIIFSLNNKLGIYFVPLTLFTM